MNFEGREMTLEPILNPFFRIWLQILDKINGQIFKKWLGIPPMPPHVMTTTNNN